MVLVLCFPTDIKSEAMNVVLCRLELVLLSLAGQPLHVCTVDQYMHILLLQQNCCFVLTEDFSPFYPAGFVF